MYIRYNIYIIHIHNMCVCTHTEAQDWTPSTVGIPSESLKLSHRALKASLCHGLDLNRKQHCNNHRSRMRTWLSNDTWRGALAQSEPW